MALRQIQDIIHVRSKRTGLYEITNILDVWLSKQVVGSGMLTIFIRHTSASLLIQENADSSVCRDLENYFSKIAPEGERLYQHNDEGTDDMPAHIRSALTLAHLSIPISNGRMQLGAWQGIYLFEHRSHPRQRELVLHLLGDEL